MTGVFLFLIPNFNLSLSGFSQLAMQKYFCHQIACVLTYVRRHVTSTLVSPYNGVIYSGIPELRHPSASNMRQRIRINTAVMILSAKVPKANQEQSKLRPPG